MFIDVTDGLLPFIFILSLIGVLPLTLFFCFFFHYAIFTAESLAN